MNITLKNPTFNHCNGCDSQKPLTELQIRTMSVSLCEECVFQLHQLLATPLARLDAKTRDSLHIAAISFNNSDTTGHIGNIVEAKVYLPGEKVALVTVYTLYDEVQWGVEVYRGTNYIVESKAMSWSKQYKEGIGVPRKYADIVIYLKKLHRREYGSGPINTMTT